jgi:hypothetical protein
MTGLLEEAMVLNVLHRSRPMTIILDSSDSPSSKINFVVPSQKGSLDCFYGSNPLINEQEYAWEMHR